MKHLKLSVLCLLAAMLAQAQNNAIFRGGAAGGWNFGAAAQAGNAIFAGSSGDGWSMGAYQQAANTIFGGGMGDGWAVDAYAQAASNLFAGGEGDGWSFHAFAQAGNSIFNGGEGDGWHYEAYLQAGNSIFGGGQGDGWASNYRALGALPVTLLEFTAKKEQSTARLQWQTASEQNSFRFDVQRSADGLVFETLGSVAAAGNSSRPVSYAFTDHQPRSGYNYYRLKGVDKDLRFQYSPVRSLLFDAVRVELLKAYPVPVAATLTVELPASLRNQEVMVNVVGSSGVVLQQWKASRNRLSDQKALDLSRLPAGAYSLQVVAEGYAASIIFVKQ